MPGRRAVAAFVALAFGATVARGEEINGPLVDAGIQVLALVTVPVGRDLSREESDRIGELVRSVLADAATCRVLGPADIAAELRKARSGSAPMCGSDVRCLTRAWKPLGVDAVGTLKILRSGGATELLLTIVAVQDGSTLRHSHVSVEPGQSLVDAAEELAKGVATHASKPESESARAPAADAAVEGVQDATTDEQDSTAAAPSRRADVSSRPVEGEDTVSPSAQLSLVAGAELGAGLWTMNPSQILAGSPNGFVFEGYALAFTQPFAGQARPAMNLHAGVNFRGWAAMEVALQSSYLSGSAQNGAVLAGARFTLLPVQLFRPLSRFDVGVELGGGYAFVGGPSFDMDGSYFTCGLTGEYHLTGWLSIGAFYRLFTPFLTRFYLDLARGRTEPVQGFTAYWNTFGVSGTLHFGLR